MIYSSGMQYIHVFSSLSHYIQEIIVQGGYFILFAMTIFEGIPLLGMLVPGHVAIMAGGFVAKLGTLNLGSVLLVSMIGALVGDYIGFYIGRKYGMSFINKLRPYLFISDNHIAKANKLLDKHTGKALIIGRFTPATRALMPFLVGTSNIHARRFWLFNVIGGFSWVFSSVMVGYIFGSAYHAVSGYIGKLLFVSIVISILFIWGYRFVNSRFHIFKKYELFTLIVAIISFIGFATVLDKLIDNSFDLNFDVSVSLIMHKFALLHPIILKTAYFVSNIGSVYSMVIIGTIVAIYFASKRKWRSMAIMFFATYGTAVVSGFLKTTFMSPRPVNSLISLSDPSFPSSHASMATAVFLAIIYLFAPKIQSWIRREIFIVGLSIFAIMIGLSRLILNVHWFSDVLAGWALGLFIASSAILFVKYMSELLIKKK